MRAQVALAAAGLASSGVANQNVLPLPPMGFNNWARFMTNISEGIFVDAAEAMSRHGLLEAGYNRINLDDAWSLMNRTANGSMAWDPEKFPRGMPWLASYLTSNGYIPGIYTDSGTKSCGGYPGAEGHEEIDFHTFKSWGFKYLKLDGCYVEPESETKYHALYTRWHEILSSTEDRMILSDSAPAYFCGQKNLTDWYTVMGWASDYGQLARHSYDIQTYPDGNSWDSMQTNYDQQIRLARYQRPGYFNDPDFLNYDHPSYTLDEKKSHFALWCSFSAPLILSANLSAIKPEEAEYLANKDLIAVDQDKLIQQATLVSRNGNIDVLTKSLDNGDRLLTILNKGSAATDVTVSWERIGLSSEALLGGDSLSVKDLWTGKYTRVAVEDGGITAKSISKHATAVYRITKPNSAITPTGIILNTFSMNCLTDSTSGQVTFATCDGSDAQTWSVRSDGNINSLLRPDECIVDAQGKVLSRSSGCQSDDFWNYRLSGNLINGNSRLCLTEGDDGNASTAPCGNELNEQVVALPVGVAVNNP